MCYNHVVCYHVLNWPVSQIFFVLPQTRKQQTRIQDVLSGCKFDFDVVDVSASRESLAKMREVVGDSKALAPQIANADEYCGVRHSLKYYIGTVL